MEADYSQIELRAACALSGDRALAEALKGDVHAATQRLLGCDRVRAKNVIYGSLYGAGPRKLNKLLQARGVRTSEAECRSLQDRLARAYPALWDWRTAVVAEGTAQRYLVNPFGRRRYFYGGSRDAPQMIDYLPQSIAADILWDRLLPLETWAESNGGHLVTTVHDSVLLEFPEETINDCLISNLRRVLEHEFDQVSPGFRVPVDIKVGETWGTMTPLERVASG